MESKSFPSVNGPTSSNFDIAGHYAKHRKQHFYATARGIVSSRIYTPAIINYTGIITHYTPDSINYTDVIMHYTPAIANYLSVIAHYMLTIAIFTTIVEHILCIIECFFANKC